MAWPTLTCGGDGDRAGVQIIMEFVPLQTRPWSVFFRDGHGGYISKTICIKGIECAPDKLPMIAFQADYMCRVMADRGRLDVYLCPGVHDLSQSLFEVYGLKSTEDGIRLVWEKEAV